MALGVKSVKKSRMMGDCQVRFCERLGVKLPRPTRLCVMSLISKIKSNEYTYKNRIENNIIRIMVKKAKLKDISIVYFGSMTNECIVPLALGESKFYIDPNHLQDIDCIYVNLKPNKYNIKELRIKHNIADNDWNVYYRSTLFFSYQHSDKKDFQDEFEEYLNKNLEKPN
ncbi:MAG: hypothetical protein NTV31_01945 [Bacteroidia bacterium]|nr:hypothetical protein [Bacteroidia bacterium]